MYMYMYFNTLHANDAFLYHWIVIKVELRSLSLTSLRCHGPMRLLSVIGVQYLLWASKVLNMGLIFFIQVGL